MEEFKCPSSGLDSRIGTQSSWPLLFWLQKIAKKYGYWCSTGPKLAFCTKLFKIRPPSATIGKWKNLFVVLFGDIFFDFFFFAFCLSRSFFALIRVTVEFFVVFPKKSHTLIRVTLGFNSFEPNTSHTLIRVTFRVKWIENSYWGVTPFLDDFWQFWPFWGQKQCNIVATMECKLLKKTDQCPHGMSSEVI